MGRAQGVDVVEDLSEVTFMDCSALRPLLVAHDRLRLQGATRQVTRPSQALASRTY